MNNSDKKILNIGRYKIELTLPDRTKDLSFSHPDNITAFDNNGLILWNISDLLKKYSEKNGLQYYSDMYFDIRLLENQNVFCVGFINHCEIELETDSIIKIINNR